MKRMRASTRGGASLLFVALAMGEYLSTSSPLEAWDASAGEAAAVSTVEPPPPTTKKLEPPPPPMKKKIVLFPGPQFGPDKTVLTAAGREWLAEAVNILKEEPEVRISLEGHSDSIEAERYNMQLSKRRASVVAKALIAYGVSPSRITVHGYGALFPVASNDTEEGRAQNRRVEMRRE